MTDHSEFLDGLEAHVSSVWEKVNKPKPIPRRSRNQRAMSTLRVAEPLPADTPPLPDERYRVIMSDPAWRYSNTNAANAPKYPTLSVAQMSELNVRSLNHPDGTVHFMWATMPLLADALTLMKAWGYEYKTTAFCWIKSKGADEEDNPLLYTGLGHYTNSNAEIVLLGRSGKPLAIQDTKVRQVVFAEVGEHSAKPAEVRLRIQRLYTDLPRLELFARTKYNGWDAWGKDVEDGVPQPVSPFNQEVITFSDPRIRDGISTAAAAEIFARYGAPVGTHRVIDFIKDGRLYGYKFGNQWVVSKATVVALAKMPRKTGRPSSGQSPIKKK